MSDKCDTDIESIRDSSYDDGRSDERSAVVAWLRGGHRRHPRPGPDETTDILRAQVFADQIERGEHVDGAGI